MQEQIDARMTETRQALLENFDDDVANLLLDRRDAARKGLDQFTRWLCDFFLIAGASRIEPLER